MFKSKEIVAVFIATLILAFLISLIETWNLFTYTFLTILAVIFINIISKKIAAFYLDSEIEIQLWTLKKFGFFGVALKGLIHPSKKIKKPIQIGAFLPFIITVLTYGHTTWLAPLVFNVKSKVHRAVKRFEIYSFSEIPEFHIGWIAATGIIANLIFGLIGYLINFPEFAKLNLYYAFFNMIPLSDLDGNKIFFGSQVLWVFLATLILFGILFGIFAL